MRSYALVLAIRDWRRKGISKELSTTVSSQIKKVTTSAGGLYPCVNPTLNVSQSIHSSDDRLQVRSFSSGKRSHFGLPLSVCERAKFRGDTARDCRGFAPGLKTGEVRTIAPCERAA